MSRDGRKTGGGSRKGRPNKLTSDVREAIHAAFVKAGGVDYLAKVAEENQSAFCKLLGMTVPREMKLDATESLFDLIARARERRSQGG